jgi:hypothetical protein
MNADSGVKEKFRSDSLPRSKNAPTPPRRAPRPVENPGPMKLRLAPAASLLLLSALVATAGAAAAQGRGQDRGAPPARSEAGRPDNGAGRHERRQDQRELSDAVRRVERSTGGQVLSAERVPFDGRNVNRVKVIDSSGRVRVYMDDPNSASRRSRPVPTDSPRSGSDD